MKSLVLASSFLTGLAQAHPGHEHHDVDHGHDQAATTTEIVSPSADGPSLKLTAEPATVGELTRIQAELRDAKGAKVAATFALKISNLEDKDQVLATSIPAPNGTIDWRQEFYDGDEHEIVVTAVPTATNLAPTVATLKLPVTAIPPPRPVIWRTFAYLLSVSTLALAGAYFRSARKPVRAH